MSGLRRINGTSKTRGKAVLPGTAPLKCENSCRKARERLTLITGGAGFIGTNLANRILEAKQPVLIFDNLSRPGVDGNLRWLKKVHGDLVQIEIGSVCNRYALRRAVRRAGRVFHFAAQVAVTTSIVDPAHDFSVNAAGTVYLLEELRALDTPPPLVFTSTNKVYGGLRGLDLRMNCGRYEPVDPVIRLAGVHEEYPLDFYSPYGCSKGSADQYVIDYARTFCLPATVFRMSCIYGPHQFGTEDQGWVAHFLISALEGKPITIYGDGMQVRDVLFVEDLVDALLLAQENSKRLSGTMFNIGGGPANAISLLELLELIRELYGEAPPLRFDSWRTGDQRYYVSDTRRFGAAVGWTPKVSVREGVERLSQWLVANRSLPQLHRMSEKESHEVCL